MAGQGARVEMTVHTEPAGKIERSLEDVYEVAVVDAMLQGQFPRPGKMWIRVEAGRRPRWYDPINGSMRMAVYRVSPAVRLIKPCFRMPTSSWRRTNSDWTTRLGFGTPCNGSGFWTIWDLKFPAVSAGQARSATEFQADFRQVADPNYKPAHRMVGVRQQPRARNRGVATGRPFHVSLDQQGLPRTLADAALPLDLLVSAGPSGALSGSVPRMGVGCAWRAGYHSADRLHSHPDLHNFAGLGQPTVIEEGTVAVTTAGR
jgi:hypothetical protein